MTITVRGIRESASIFRNVEAFLQSTRPMEGIVKDIEEGIEKKTRTGKDYRGRKFAPYSAQYKKRKKKAKVDLRDTGEMLDSMKSKVINPKHGVVEIRGKREIIAQIHTTGTGKQPQREFMNITKSALSKLVKKHYDDKIMRILGRR